MLFLISLVAICVAAYIQAKRGVPQEENLDSFSRRINMLIKADNYLICVSAILVVCSLVSEVVQNGWPAQYGAMLMINLSLDLLFIALFIAFIKASELYSEHCIQRLYGKDEEFSYKEKFAWYDYELLFIPIVLPIVKMCFEDFVEKKQQTTTTEPEVTPFIRSIDCRK